MVALRLESQSPKNVNGIQISLDPDPNFSFDDILKELNVLESKLGSSPLVLRPPDKLNPWVSSLRGNLQDRSRNVGEKAFVVRVSDDDFDDLDSDDERQTVERSLVRANRYACPDVYLSDSDSEDESRLQIRAPMVEKMGVVEGALLEISHEYDLYVKEELRNQISSLETELLAEKEKSVSALDQLEKTTKARRDMDRKLDMHYQRRTAEALDDHLTAVQRDHEHKSQKVEREISDAAAEEARKKEKALQEERLRQQKAKAEQEAKREAERRAEEARKADEARRADEARQADEARRASLDAERRAAEKDASLSAQQISSKGPGSGAAKLPQSSGSIVRAAESALKLEESRLQMCKELAEKHQMLISDANRDYISYMRSVARLVRTIRGTLDNVRTKANELVKMLNNPSYPQPVTAAIFAREVVSLCEAPKESSVFFACGCVIVLVSSQVPLVMDLVLAEFYKACIYTVPKHIMYSKSAFETNEAYYKSIGYRKEDGELEKTENYLNRVRSYMKLYGALVQTEAQELARSYMKLYGALVQTEAQGAKNSHGIEEAWRWLARFLNALPANRYTLVALDAFLNMAGFALHQKYKSQFQKVLNAVSRDFLGKLKGRADAQDHSSTIYSLETREFLKEPEGRRLQGALLSSTCVPDQEYQQSGYGYSNSYHRGY